MEAVSTIIGSALGYILKAAAKSKTAEKAKEEVLGKFWSWIKPKFIKDVPELESKAQTEETQKKTEERLVELIKDEDFFNELAMRVKELQDASIREKNIVRKDIKNMKRIRIGDKEYHPNEVFHRKNIVEGSVEGADEFVLGDGH
ncbi:MAG: hypothetical protein JEZ03_03125 [Bacteroidales bacterium]|nr:hypothetical protein [Bacteroidales bacterium]